MLLDIINIERLRKAIIYLGVMLATLFVQNSILSQIPILGVKAMFVPIVVVAVGFFEDGMWGGIFGLLLGLFCDISFGDSPIMFTVLFPIIGFFAGCLTMFFVTRRFWSFFFISLAALALAAFCQMFSLLVISGTSLWPLLKTGGLQVLWSIPLTLAVYSPCRKISGLDLSK